MKKSVLFIIGCFLIGLVACKKESRLTTAQHHDVTAVSGPATGAVNTDIVLTVTYPYINGCDYIGSFEQASSGNEITIKAMSRPVEKDAVCTQDAGSRTVEYQFKSAVAGIFKLRFLKPDGNAVEHTITVQ